MSRQRQQSEELIDMIQAELHPELRSRPTVRPTHHQSPHGLGVGRVGVLGVPFIVMATITLLCTQLSTFLPDELLLISAIIHGVNLVVVMAIMLGYGRWWHMLYWVLTHKFIATMANNSHGCVLHKDTLLQLVCSVVLYATYMYHTHRTTLSSTNYVAVVVLSLGAVVVRAWDTTKLLSHAVEMGWLLLYIGMGCCYSMANHPHPKCITLHNISASIIRLLKIKPTINNNNNNNNNYSKIVWLSCLLLAILCTVEQCREYWIWMLMWMLSVVFASGTHQSIRYLRSRSANVMVGWGVIMLGQWVLTLHRDTSPQSIFMFHLTTLMSILIVYLHATLQYHQHFQAPTLTPITSLTLIKFHTPTHSTRHNDKPYQRSLLQLMLTLQFLLVAQAAIAYTVYSYLYYYHSSRVTNNSQEQNRFYGSWRHDRILVSKPGVGYAIMAIFGLTVGRLASLWTTHQDNENNTMAQLAECRKGKFMIGYMLLSWVFYFYQLRSQFGKWVTQLLQLTPFNLLLPSAANIDSFYRLHHYLHSCQFSKSSHLVFLFILATTLYLIIHLRIQPTHYPKPTLLTRVYWGCLLLMYFAAVGLVAGCHCVQIGQLTAWALAAVVLLLTGRGIGKL